MSTLPILAVVVTVFAIALSNDACAAGTTGKISKEIAESFTERGAQRSVLTPRFNQSAIPTRMETFNYRASTSSSGSVGNGPGGGGTGATSASTGAGSAAPPSAPATTPSLGR